MSTWQGLLDHQQYKYGRLDIQLRDQHNNLRKIGKQTFNDLMVISTLDQLSGDFNASKISYLHRLGHHS